MEDLSRQDRGVELLKQLGLKEYEAKCFVALSRLPSATAKRIAEISDVPRTRVYDAVRVLETKGLVEIQHSNPQKFRAVTVDEAAETLRAEYEDRTEDLRETLTDVEPAPEEDRSESSHQVWSLTGSNSILTRTRRLIDEADDEVVIVAGTEQGFRDELIRSLKTASARGVTVIAGAPSRSVRDRIEDRLPDSEVFVSGLEWLGGDADTGDTVAIGHLLLVDRDTILVSSIRDDESDTTHRAVFGRGFTNGLVVIVRRLMATGLLRSRDPG